jgi:hypothetical protein
MNRLIDQFQLVAKVGNEFGNVHKTRAANGLVAGIAVHRPMHGISVIADARMPLPWALLVPIVDRVRQAHCQDNQSQGFVLRMPNRVRDSDLPVIVELPEISAGAVEL